MGSKAKWVRGDKGRARQDNKTGVQMKESDEKKENGELSRIPIMQAPTFCVAMLKNGTTVKLEGSVEEFIPTLKDADFAWINVQADDLKDDGIKVASSLGF